MFNLKDYEVTQENIKQLVNVESGFILNPFIGYKGWSKLDELSKVMLPNIEVNAKFYRKKNIHRTKVLHVTDELEIIDVSLFKDEADKLNGNIEQYIGDGEIITELNYSVREDNEVYLKRVKNELLNSYLFYSKKGYERRFYIEGMSDNEKEQFTSLVLSNAQTIINYLNVE